MAMAGGGKPSDLPRRIEADAAAMLDNFAAALKSSAVAGTAAENAQLGLAARTAALKVVHAAEGLTDVCATLRADMALQDAEGIFARLETSRGALEAAERGAERTIDDVRVEAETALAEMEDWLARSGGGANAGSS